MTITEFLTARLDEDEAVARAASPGPWHTDAEAHEVLAVDDITVADGFALSSAQVRATTRHIARHDPAYVLADIAAKRAIVALHSEGTMACYWSHDSMEMHGPGEVCDTLQALAQPFAEHPDFDESWKP